MIRHIVMWKMRRPTDAPRFKHLLESCKGLVPGMLEFDVAVRSPSLEATQDVVLVSAFVDEASMQAYLNHPHHQSVAKVLADMRASRDVLDYDVEGSRHHDVEEDPAFAPTMLQTPF
jgi:quinol monooxygenase YgiN